MARVTTALNAATTFGAGSQPDVAKLTCASGSLKFALSLSVTNGKLDQPVNVVLNWITSAFSLGTTNDARTLFASGLKQKQLTLISQGGTLNFETPFENAKAYVYAWLDCPTTLDGSSFSLSSTEI